MNELKHWLDESSEADEFERSILRAGLEADPPDAKREHIWSELMSTLAIAPLPSATTSAQAASIKAATVGVSKAGTVSLAVAKGFLVGLTIYGAGASVNEISNRLGPGHARTGTEQTVTPARATSSRAESLTATSAFPLAPPTPASDEVPGAVRAAQRDYTSAKVLAREPLNPVAELPSVATFDDSEHSSSPRTSQLEAETRALRRARDELRVDKLADAFATLEASRRQFSAPELYQEREALMIELLYRSGQATAAEQRARAFLSRFPESPHAQQIRRFTASGP
ncbi:MAG: hypothetical protein WDO69_33375 [Pseudomonadota bacterium]